MPRWGARHSRRLAVSGGRRRRMRRTFLVLGVFSAVASPSAFSFLGVFFFPFAAAVSVMVAAGARSTSGGGGRRRRRSACDGARG